MNSIELLTKYKHASSIIKSWYMGKMLESFADTTVPDDFKEFMRKRGVDDEQLSKMIDGSPRLLFDVFDENNIFIQININNGRFSYCINEENENMASWDNRKDAEYNAISLAFEMLEKNITDK